MENSKDTKNIKKGFPLGIKINEEELINGLSIDELIRLTECYHGNNYVVGKDTQFCQKPHYHIHFFSVKDTSLGAMKTFRSNVIKKNFSHISKSFRFYSGQDLENVDPNLWLAYCIKETQVKVSGHSITDEILILAKSQFQVKQMKDVHSQKKKIEQKEKMDFKQQMFEYVKANYTKYCKENDYEDKYGNVCITAVRRLIIKYLREQDKYGSIVKFRIQQYTLEYLGKYCNYSEKDIDLFLGF